MNHDRLMEAIPAAIAQERLSTLRGGPCFLIVYLAAVDWANLDSEHQQFAVYPWRSPQWVLLALPSDEVANLAPDLRATTM